MSDYDQPDLLAAEGKNPTPLPIETKMSQAYLDYAMSVIVARALPDVRDGLKPVHRRLLYAMDQLNLTSKAKYRKCALVVGEVLGKYHPHGDTAVYHALARLAQDFSMRYPLIDGQGNFGSIDGDRPAAMRYTECRMDEIADVLLEDLGKNTVDFVDNYDGSRQEPSVLPALLPNLLINGGAGIAVGMATNIPPHNLGEVVQATIHLLENPDASVEDLLTFIQGPDFPTGGAIYDWNAITNAYLTGRGSMAVRGTAEIEEGKHGKTVIIITELPYQVNKANLVAKVGELVRDKKIKGISELRDESDRHGMRIYIELKRDFPAQKVLNLLYKHTELQSSFALNMLALVDGKQPQLLNLKQVLVEYLKHRHEVVVRRTKFDLEKAKARAHILEGLTKALDHLDEVIALIRKSESAEAALNNLMERFAFSQPQAQAILDMQLRRLAALEREKIEQEYRDILNLIKDLEDILANPERVDRLIKEELQHVVEKYGDPRKTVVNKQPIDKDWSPEDFIPNEPTLVMVTENGYIKRLSPDTYRTQRRGGKGIVGMTTKEDDAVRDLFVANTHNQLFIFTSHGRVFKLPVYEIPEAKRVARGQAIVNMVDIQQGEGVTAILSLDPKQVAGAGDQYILMATKKGVIKKTAINQFANIRKTGIIAINLQEDDALHWVKLTDGAAEVIMVTSAGQSIRFAEGDVRPMGRASQGVRAIKLRKDDIVVEMDIIAQADDDKLNLLVVMENGLGKRTLLSEYKVQRRGGSGLKTANVTKKTGTVVAARVIDDQIKEIVLTSQKGQIIRTTLESISLLGRVTQGVRIFRFSNSNDKVSALSCMREKANEEAGEEDVETSVASPVSEQGNLEL